jgi:hypothetical protein
MTLKVVCGVVLASALFTGCDSAKDQAKLKEAERNLNSTIKNNLDALQWRIDDATAVHVFENGSQSGVNRYLAFRKCHEEPPTHDKNKLLCADLRGRVALAEAMDRRASAERKAKW